MKAGQPWVVQSATVYPYSQYGQYWADVIKAYYSAWEYPKELNPVSPHQLINSSISGLHPISQSYPQEIEHEEVMLSGNILDVIFQCISPLWLWRWRYRRDKEHGTDGIFDIYQCNTGNAGHCSR